MADVIISAGFNQDRIGNVGKTILKEFFLLLGALATFIGADSRLYSEYFAMYYPHNKDDDDIYKIRSAVVGQK